MATIILSDGVDETEPTLISDNAMQDSDGAEYRVGQKGIFVARGRDQIGDLGSLTGLGLYEAGFDGNAIHLVVHQGNSLHSAPIVSGTLSLTLLDNLPSGSSAIVGSHYASRHYLATGVGNRRIEFIGGATSSTMGMSNSGFAVGVSVTQGAGGMNATIGLEYWVNEYDPSRGIESIKGSTVNTGVFDSLDSVIATATGSANNPNATQLRWYRSVDGGGYPDGGLIQTTPIGTTQITDENTATASLTVPQYGLVSIGGIDNDRDSPPPIFSSIFGPFQDSLLGIGDDEPRVLRFTPAGFPDSWPAGYALPIETDRNDVLVTGVILSGRFGVFATNSVHAVFRLPRDSDSIFAAGEAQDIVTDERGCPSNRGATTFTPPVSSTLAIWVSLDGIWASDLTSSPVPLTDRIDWEGRVDIPNLFLCRLVNDPINRRLVFIHRRKADTTHNTGLWYLDYQEFNRSGIRVIFADHGPLVDAVSTIAPDASRRLISLDSRSTNGQIYIEGNQDVDDSQLRDGNGSVRFRVRTKEFLPGGARGAVALGKATWMHDAGPIPINHNFYFNRKDSNPEKKKLSNPDSRNASDVVLGKTVNSTSLEIESSGTKSYGVHWVDIENLALGKLGGAEGA